MGRKVYSSGALIEEWDDTTQTYRRYANGAVVEQRPYTAPEIAAMPTLADVTIDGGDLRILDAGGNVVFSSANGPIQTGFAQGTDLSVTFTADLADYLATPIVVPNGYTQAIVQIFASARGFIQGTGSGTIAVQARAGPWGGPLLSNGLNGGGAISANSSLAIKLPVVAGTPLVLKANASYAGGALVAGESFVHLSATIIFARS